MVKKNLLMCLAYLVESLKDKNVESTEQNANKKRLTASSQSTQNWFARIPVIVVA
jgi:hypothetical protein